MGMVFAGPGFPTPDATANMVQAAEAAGFSRCGVPSTSCPRWRQATRGMRRRAAAWSGFAARRHPDPIVWLTFAAAHSNTIRLGTNVVILPEHHPTVFAKSVATLDQLSNGRVLLGIGVGRRFEEYATVGMEFTNRGKRMDEYMEVMRTLWENGVRPTTAPMSRSTRSEAIRAPSTARCTTHRGASPAAVRRAAKHGDGYFPWVDPRSNLLHETLGQVIPAVRAEAERFTVTPGPSR